MTQENLNILGMTFIPQNLNDVLGRTPVNFKYHMDQWVASQPTGLLTRYFILIQDKTDLGFEVLQADNPRTNLKRVALGKATRFMHRRYPDQDTYIANVNVYIAHRGNFITKQTLENHMLGQWVDKEAEAARARRMGGLIKRASKERVDEFIAENPTAWKFLNDGGYV